MDKVYTGLMIDMEISKVDSVHLKIDCEKDIARELSDFFTFTVPNHQYTPAFKNKKWDGQIRLFNLHTRKMYMGLESYILSFAEDRNYTVKLNIPKLNDKIISNETVKGFMCEHLNPHSDGKKIIPHKHQIDAVSHAINNQRSLILSPTGSGKSLVIYSLVRYYLDILPKNKKILIIVPTTSLVLQMYNDFNDYSSNAKWNASYFCHTIYSGMDKDTEKRVVISTWQSLYNQPEEYFKDFGAIFGDEAHLYQAKSLTKIMSNLKTCDVRVGTTGTLTDSQTHRLVIEGLFGGVFRATSARTLMNEKLLSDISIDCINLQYTDKDVQETKRMKYPEEMKWLIGNEKRNKFISNLANNLKSNTLILFNYVELHGKPLYNMIQEESSNRKVFFIHGGTDAEQRENIRKIVDSEKNAILVASYGTCSTGVNIKNIHNIIFASPSKSVIRILQSIGRGLRITKTKDTMKLYDISDDLRYKKWTNHTMRHLDERLKIYNREKFNFKLIRIRLGDEINA